MIMTKSEIKIYNFIVDYRNKNGFSPSMDDISKNCFMSKTAVHKHINNLFEKNYITYVPKIARSIVIN